MTTVVHVVPHLPPRVSGVGDFALQLGSAIETRSGGGLHSVFVASGWDAAAAEAPAVNLTGRRDPGALVEALGALAPSAVLLHYVGYGYEQRGHPTWLVRALRAFRRACPEVRVLTWFHELYATGPPWRSSFWTSPIQRRVAADLARLGDAAFTNRHASADWLRAHAPGVPVVACPTPSNIGEPETVRPWGERDPVAVVFGGAGQRQAVYRHQDAALISQLDQSGVDRILDIGPSEVAPALFAGRPVEALGQMDAEHISPLLEVARVGLVHYDPAFLTKSGIVAAYLAHGVPVVTLSPDTRPAGCGAPPFARLQTPALEDIKDLGTAGHAWYQSNARLALAAKGIIESVFINEYR